VSIQRTLLAAAAVLTLAAPAAALAEPGHGDRGDHRGDSYRGDRSGGDWGRRDRVAEQDCRVGVFYLGGSCGDGRVYDGWRADHRHDDHRTGDRRWR